MTIQRLSLRLLLQPDTHFQHDDLHVGRWQRVTCGFELWPALTFMLAPKLATAIEQTLTCVPPQII
jgi:hypothetical protein